MFYKNGKKKSAWSTASASRSADWFSQTYYVPELLQDAYQLCIEVLVGCRDAGATEDGLRKANQQTCRAAFMTLLFKPILYRWYGPVPTFSPTPTFDEASIAVLKDVTPLVAGKWTLERVYVRRQPYYLYPQSFPKDTILQQFATLTLALASSPGDARYPQFEGTLFYKGTTYPISFSLQANPTRVLRQQGPPALLLFGYKGPIPLHTTTAGEQFLYNIGLIDEHFTLEVTKGQPLMTWQGQKRHLERIEFHR